MVLWRIAIRWLVLASFAAMLCVPVRAQSDEAALFEAIRTADLELATIGFRLSTANAPLCDRLEPGLGIQLHTLAQYNAEARDSVRTHFRFGGTVAVEGVIAGGPAERAGLKADDTVIGIGNIAIPRDFPGAASTAALEALHAAIAGLPPAAPVEITVLRAGVPRHMQIVPIPACRTRYELRTADMFDARATGDFLQVTSKYLEDIDRELLPALIAHELAHNILRHRERLEAAGAGFGLVSGFGRNVGLFRQTEIQADILSVHLLVRAGYDPRIAARFWGEVGPRLIAGMIRSRSHPPFKDRVATVEAEAARIAAAGGPAPPPAFLADRDKPLDGKWQPLLVRAR